jgi:hypothetical protein
MTAPYGTVRYRYRTLLYEYMVVDGTIPYNIVPYGIVLYGIFQRRSEPTRGPLALAQLTRTHWSYITLSRARNSTRSPLLPPQVTSFSLRVIPPPYPVTGSPRTPKPGFVRQSRTHNILFCPRLPLAAQWPQCRHTLHIGTCPMCLPLCRFSAAASNERAADSICCVSSSTSRLSPPGPCALRRIRDETAQT